MELASKRCMPCRGGIPPLTRVEAEQKMAEVPGWQLTEEARQLQRKFTFADFTTALAFVNQVGALAEQEDHHPDIRFGWGYVDVIFYTHKINGLHDNDFIMAAKVNGLDG